MAAVAIDAGGHLAVALGQMLAVNAGRIFGILVHSLRGVILPHEVRIAVAPGAEFRDCRPYGHSYVSAGLAHGGLRIVRIGVAAVASGARESMLEVHATLKCRRRRKEVARHLGVALQTGILSGQPGGRQQEEEECVLHRRYPSRENVERSARNATAP